ncbi:MAG: isochorismate synthase MenF [Actinomycetota bacterium]
MTQPQVHAVPRTPLRVITTPLAHVDNLVALLPPEETAAWVRRGEGLIGWGVAARLQVRGDERFSRTQRWWTDLLAHLTIEDSVSLPGTGPVAFGSFAFDARQPSEVIVPRIVIGMRAGQAWVTALDAPVPTEPPLTSVPDAPTTVRWSEGSRSPLAWQQSVAQALARIDSGELDKVVLARDVIAHVAGSLDVRYLLQRLAARYPSCWTFHVAGLVGATPELLVRRTGDLVTSRVLAGTVRTIGDADADEGMAQALLGSDKDLEEHEYAVRSVARALATHCTDLEVPDHPRVLELANVQHLATDVTGRLADTASVLSLVASLHPTAAVCGTPTERAFSVITDLEGMDRGRYAGPVGWFDAHGDGEFGIALRCAEIDSTEGTVRAFAGCGIVAGSEPEKELAESNAKLVPIRDALEANS